MTVFFFSEGGGHSSLPNADMVTMNSEKVGAKRKPETSVAGCAGGSNEDAAVTPYQPSTASEESPNHLLYKKVGRGIFF